MQGTYNLALVALSFGVAVMASFTALDLAGRVRAARQGKRRLLWRWGGAFAMGTGIWAMHFIGMLALQLPMKTGYDLGLTALSMLAAVLSSALALGLVNVPRLGGGRLLAGGLAMGLGICAMHYVGMAAMEMPTRIHYDGALLWLSVLVAVSAASAALWLAFRLNPGSDRPALGYRLAAALAMGVAICGMHYTGMAAARFPLATGGMASDALSSIHLAIGVALVAASIMMAGLVMAVFDAHLASHNARLAASLQEANAELQAMVMHDPLTRLPNRLLLEQRLDAVLAEARRLTLPFAVFFVDLDRFKGVNDSLGHHVGDALIQAAASRLKKALGDDGLVARVGGDEFLVLTFAGTDRAKSAALAEEMVALMTSAFCLDGNEVRISCSVGISCYPDNGADKHELMVHADAAMYQAKAAGRSNFQFFEAGMTSAVERRQVLEKRLRLALEQGSLSLAYQPKILVADNSLTGLEALLRWQDEELGQVSPDELIPVAEETGLILPLGDWVLRTACAQAAAWSTRFESPLPVAVNLSAIQLNQHDFVKQVSAILVETGLDPALLELELTESAVMQNPERARGILEALRKLGVTLSIDDFGTGYSNLVQLKRFPIHRLKIDRSFTAGVLNDPQDAAIVQAVMALAHSLKLDVVAEGVETEDQLDFIRALQGQQYQGYLCSKALAPLELEAFLADWQQPGRRKRA
ncbi:EAL domain-containing protein [Gallaecimonas kandeliae]|uniref:putative bifunctional diguanylate cyclase/phosphodiesterase n=1 Tax=Gallaecimonas kandeliae TaxID=3029055 RepID=UPI00264842C9|nr:EAL domain-containing protein [Gallaecimonas kandeliae]WKE67173.1 EAL domain-containing protein [Gallaecimonas kandeliae]